MTKTLNRIASTHIDRHGDRLTQRALKSAKKQIEERLIPHTFEHDPRIAGYTGSLDSLLDMLNDIRLGTMLEESKKSGKPKATYVLEEMTEAEQKIITALGVDNAHNEQPKIKHVGVYN